jgi:hypothetical protein
MKAGNFLPPLLPGNICTHWILRPADTFRRLLSLAKKTSNMPPTFVTYAIEVRADKLYPVYQEVLTEASKIMVKSIILEEEGHLEEMINQLHEFSQNWQLHADHILEIEKTASAMD